MSGYMYDDSCEMHSDVYLSEHQASLADEQADYDAWVEAHPEIVARQDTGVIAAYNVCPTCGAMAQVELGTWVRVGTVCPKCASGHMGAEDAPYLERHAI